MRKLVGLPVRWARAPAAIVVTVVLLLLAGIGIIVQSEAAYREVKAQETRGQAEILAASVAAALDFGDAGAAGEAIEAIRLSGQMRSAAVYDANGVRFAGYGRDGPAPPRLAADRATGADGAVTAEVPVTIRGERIGTVALTSDPEPLARRLTRYVIVGLLILLAALVVGILGLAQGALRRVNLKLKERASALAAANAELKVQIAERGKAEEQLRQASKMQALGQLTGGIAHDFNNLLTVIQGSADMLRRPDLSEARRVRFAEAAVQASARAAALTGQLLAFARRQPLKPEVIDVNALIRGMTDLLDRSLGERVQVETELVDGACRVAADRPQLESALLNVAVNGRDAMPEGGRLTIATYFADDEVGGRMIAISVADSGSGMDEDTLARAFEPFFTTKQTGKGTGLGLSQVYGFATQSGGDVRIESSPGAGTSVTLLLPCSSGEEEGAVEEEASGPTLTRTGRILVVEDNEEVGEFAEQLLRELGHDVVRAETGEEALLALADGAPCDAVFTDVVMPGMSGLDLAARLAEVRPGLPVILTTGYSDEIATSGAGGRPVILKPYRPETLAAAIETALGAVES
ncbi:MAG TPA: ATP-binding protein [Allosphingosinicella sp.]|jgi:signal transduction histidine kinase/CheY-like chemotaxis protein